MKNKGTKKSIDKYSMLSAKRIGSKSVPRPKGFMVPNKELMSTKMVIKKKM